MASFGPLVNVPNGETPAAILNYCVPTLRELRYSDLEFIQKVEDQMRQLSAAGQQAIHDLAQRHGFSSDSVLSMLQSVVDGHGSMAQFSHPEFGGSGQWMRGGMIMVSDMFNNLLKGRIDALCRELSALVASQPDLIPGGTFQSQSQGSQRQGGSRPAGPVSLFVPPADGGSGNWWPGDLGRASSTGAQNGVRYAYFAQARRLAIEIGGKVTVYDTLDHQIGSFSQQQSHGGSFTFSSQYGLVDVATLPIVSAGGEVKFAPPSPPAQPSSAAAQPINDIFVALEKLGELHGKGILSEEEFASKKAELLSRL
jgi:Short C-terminal domain